MEGGKLKYPEKNPWSKDENQQQTHGTIPAPIKILIQAGKLVSAPVLAYFDKDAPGADPDRLTPFYGNRSNFPNGLKSREI